MQKILVIDDSPTMQNLVRSLLAKNDYAVDLAENGEVGLKKVESFEPDLVVTDVNMPEVNGYELIKAVRGSPKRKSLPIIVLTTETSEGSKAELKSVGASAWIAKPYDDDVLLKMVSHFLN